MSTTKRKHKSPSDIRHNAQKRDERVAKKAKGSDIPMPPSDCVDCGRTDHRKTDGAEIYPHRPDLAHKQFLICDCGAYVGFHVGTDIPLGRPAGKATQRARSAAHAAFDALWKRKAARDNVSLGEARGRAYAWLARELGIDGRSCHMGWMSAEEARRVREVCLNPAARRAAAEPGAEASA